MKNILILMLLLMCLRSNGFSKSFVITNWAKADELLIREARGDISETNMGDLFSSSHFFKEIKSTKNMAIFLDMTRQKERPFLVLAGFLCIKELFPKQALKAGIEVILFSPTPGIEFHNPIFKYLSECEYNEDFREAFTQAFLNNGADITNLEFVVMSLPYINIRKWYDETLEDIGSASAKAVILDTLIGDAARNKQAISPRMTSDLNKLSCVPGLPRIVFLTHFSKITHSSKGNETFYQNLSLVCEDIQTTPNTLYSLTLQYPEYVSRILRDDNNLTNALKERLNSTLNKVLRRKKRANLPK